MNGRQKANLMIILIISISALTISFVSAALTGDYVTSQTLNSQNEDAKKLLTVSDGDFTANKIKTVKVVKNTYTTNKTNTNLTNINNTSNDTNTSTNISTNTSDINTTPIIIEENITDESVSLSLLHLNQL